MGTFNTNQLIKSKWLLAASVLITIIFWSCQEKSTQTSSGAEVNTVTNLHGQKVPVDSINAFLDYKMNEMSIPGLSLAIINEGKVVYHATKGYADLKEEQLVTDKTLFEAASTSKPLFAYLIMFLVEEGRLDLDKPLYEYLTVNARSNYSYDTRYKKITARMVLSHTTGFPNWRGDSDLTIQFDPGTDFSYSGEGYQFLVRSVESILDTDYNGLEEYFQQKVAVPVGMKHTKYVQDEYNLKHKALPYNQGKPLALNLWTAKEFNAASAVHTDAADFSKWMIALVNEKGLSKESYEQLFKDQITVDDAPSLLIEEGAIAWTLGFAKYRIADLTVYGHEGNNDGFNGLFLIEKDKKWGMVQFNNANEVYDFGFDLFKYINRY